MMTSLPITEQRHVEEEFRRWYTSVKSFLNSRALDLRVSSICKTSFLYSLMFFWVPLALLISLDIFKALWLPCLVGQA